MTFISLFSSKQGFVASDQHVFAPHELTPLKQVVEQAALLDQRLAKQTENEQQALEAALEQGRLEGLAQGRAEAAIQIASQIQNLHDQQSQAIVAVRSSCAELAVDIVRKIAGNVDSAQWLVAQAHQAADDVLDQPTLKLRVHSSHVDAVRKLLAEGGPSRIHSVLADDALSEKACILDSDSGQIDISLDTQLDSILRVFADAPGAVAPGANTSGTSGDLRA